MQHDEIIKCPKSGGDICYMIQNTSEITTYMSLSCGFWTNTLMKEGEEFYDQQIEFLPELFKDLIWEDPETNLRWIPQTINVEEKGIVFPYGSDASNWKWASVKARPVTEEEMKNPTLGETKFKTDMSTMYLFEENQFVQALDYIDALEG